MKHGVTCETTMTSVLCCNILRAGFESRLAWVIGRPQLTHDRVDWCNVNTRMKTGLISFVMTYAICAPLKAQAAAVMVPSHRDSVVAQRVAGCYEVLRDGWESDTNLAKFEFFPRGRIRFELTAKPARGWDALWAYEHVTYFDVIMDSITRPGGRLFSTWKRVSDTAPAILISRPLSPGGWDLWVTPRGTDLVGNIVATTDAVPADGKASAAHAVTARRIPCIQRRL